LEVLVVVRLAAAALGLRVVLVAPAFALDDVLPAALAFVVPAREEAVAFVVALVLRVVLRVVPLFDVAPGLALRLAAGLVLLLAPGLLLRVELGLPALLREALVALAMMVSLWTPAYGRRCLASREATRSIAQSRSRHKRRLAFSMP
jgi:hypothetical protein